MQVRCDVDDMLCDDPDARPSLRFNLASKCVSAMASVVTCSKIGSSRFVATRAFSRRNAGKSSWKRPVSKSMKSEMRVGRSMKYVTLLFSGRIYFKPSTTCAVVSVAVCFKYCFFCRFTIKVGLL